MKRLLAGSDHIAAGKAECRVFLIVSSQPEQLTLADAIYNPSDIRPVDSPCAHHAGFEICIQRALSQNLGGILLRRTQREQGLSMIAGTSCPEFIVRTQRKWFELDESVK